MPAATLPVPHSKPVIAWKMAVAALVVAPLSLLYMLICVVLIPSRVLRIRVGKVYGTLVGNVICSLAGIKTRVTNREGLAGPAVFVCNHASTVDMWAGMPISPHGSCGVAKKEIVRIPFFGQAYLLSGHLLVDRGNRESAVASMEKAGRVVKENRLSIWMWPEGTRSRDGRLRPLKKGFVHLAIATGLPVVPVVFHDAHLLWPGRTLRIAPGELNVEVLPPIDTSNWKPETAGLHALQVQSALQAALGEDQRMIDAVSSSAA
jgi:1-acyl-sn-glycerol-3-phosphate acyltransferase